MTQRVLNSTVALVGTLASFLSLSGLAYAGCLDAPDHFDPPDSILAARDWSLEYRSAVRKALLGDARDDPYIRVVVLPSFFPEWVLSVSQPVDGQAKVELVEARKRVYSTERYRRPSTTSSVTTIDAVVAESLRSVLEKLLLDTRPCAALDGRIGVDGVTYEFSAWVRNRGTLSGESWSPGENTRAGQLVQAINLMVRITRAGPEPARDLSQQLQDVVIKLRSEVVSQR